MEEELARVLVGPVVGDGVSLFGIAFDVRYDFFERAVVADELESGVWADFGDGIDIVAAE